MPAFLIRMPTIIDFYFTAVSQLTIYFEGAQSRHIERRCDIQRAWGAGPIVLFTRHQMQMMISNEMTFHRTFVNDTFENLNHLQV